MMNKVTLDEIPNDEDVVELRWKDADGKLVRRVARYGDRPRNVFVVWVPLEDDV
jgi:hypothetical protein